MGSSVELGGVPEYGSHFSSPREMAVRPLPERHVDVGQAPVPPATQPPRWEGRYAKVVAAGDILSLLCVVAIGHLLDLGSYWPRIGGVISPELGLIVLLQTAVTLRLCRAWDQRVLGQGSEEFSRLLRGFVTSAVVLALAGLALELTAVRPWVFGLLPLAGLLALVGRMALRRWLYSHRARGRFMHPMLAVGTIESVADIVQRTRRDPQNGWTVMAACTPTGVGTNGSPDILGVPVAGDLDAVAEAARQGKYRVVSVGRTPGWTGNRLRRLAWDLEGLNTDLVVDPGLMEMAGPRLHIAPVDGLPLLRLTHPTFDGASRVVKDVVDRIGAAVLLVVTAPLLLLIALMVKSDGGPVFFRQDRVGRYGKTFKMIKFRSMCVDAEARKAELQQSNEGAGPLFKLRHDPRVTAIGTRLRKYSLDELPQLFNVLAGSMSLVGPRPPLAEEVAQYSRDAERKLLVRPGLTGLWQVSGRSDLSWEESVRLDLRYVENWSLAMDALILWKTLGAVVRNNGSY
jgi:exopolysaccharide biosynthesis polyprenyl glycosylphosphotransferase